MPAPYPGPTPMLQVYITKDVPGHFLRPESILPAGLGTISNPDRELTTLIVTSVSCSALHRYSSLREHSLRRLIASLLHSTVSKDMRLRHLLILRICDLCKLTKAAHNSRAECMMLGEVIAVAA